VIPRVIAALGFKPALLIQDSFSYMKQAVRLIPLSQLRPEGYPLLLKVLEPFHSLLLVTTLQHLMGIGEAIIVYGLLRYWGLPGWGASLATVPTLFDARQIALESYILPDAVFGFVILVAVALLLTKRSPGTWPCLAAGLLLAWASILRGNGAPIMVALLAFMLIRRVGWRPFCAGLAGFAIPLAAYVAVFDSTYGQLDITDSTGLFLWSRTMSFANCAVIKPPADRDHPARHRLVSIVAARRTDPWGVPLVEQRLVAPRRAPGGRRLQQQAGHAVRGRCDQGAAAQLPAGDGRGRPAYLPGD
jgi:hypothetical protein